MSKLRERLVALHTEGVDRNQSAPGNAQPLGVALHTEGVDRNNPVYRTWCVLLVALHTEGVDRNLDLNNGSPLSGMSPSTRRAWIEIVPVPGFTNLTYVALHTEGVDRNSLAFRV